jgi:rare lipoprotein A
MVARSPFARLRILVAGVALVAAACGRARASAPVPTAPVPTAPSLGAGETGLASWYGHPYHGRRSASGEIYDMEKLTAAHRTLPFGTRVRVSNLENGRRVEVRINDRGPFVEDCVIDLSRAAARQIGMLGPGKAHVRLEVLGAAAAATAAARAVTERYAVQVGAFRERAGAERVRRTMERRYGSAQVVVREGEPVLWRVLVGRAASADEAAALARRIRSEAGEANGVPFVVRLD